VLILLLRKVGFWKHDEHAKGEATAKTEMQSGELCNKPSKKKFHHLNKRTGRESLGIETECRINFCFRRVGTLCSTDIPLEMGCAKGPDSNTPKRYKKITNLGVSFQATSPPMLPPFLVGGEGRNLHTLASEERFEAVQFPFVRVRRDVEHRKVAALERLMEAPG
jgi:hypothetical protein